jgi:methionyl aminopeptidase
MVRPKDARELALMREAGHILAGVLIQLRKMVAPGVSTGALDRFAEELIRKQGAAPSFKGYHGYPGSVCTSINQEIVHGIPGPRKLMEGDIVSIDAGVIWKGYQSDSAITVAVGQVSDQTRRLIEATEAALAAGIKASQSGVRLGDVSAAIEAVARAAGFEIIREYGGHGIGKQMHEPPRIPNWGTAGRGLVLKAGMTFCLEPMLCSGDYATRVLADGWTVVTVDGSLSAHSEHTLVVTDRGGEILSRLNE